MDVIKGTGRNWTDDRVYLECSCDMPEHMLRISVWRGFNSEGNDKEQPEILIEHYLQPAFKWYKRLWVGIKYILGIGRHDHQFVETMLQVNQVKALQGFLTKNFS